MTERAHRIVKEAASRGEGDFVEELASELPLQAIADLIGVPQEDRKKLFHWSNSMLASEDPDFQGDPPGGGDGAAGLRDGDGGGAARRTRRTTSSPS